MRSRSWCRAERAAALRRHRHFAATSEAVPDVYARMLANLGMLQDGLKALNVEIGGGGDFTIQQLQEKLTELLEISRKELAGEDLTEEEYDFITDFPGPYSIGFDPDVKKTTLVADVLTDGNTPQEVLEEGTGTVDLMVVAYKLPDGRVIAGVGPVMSYYEFKEPLDSRLTDEAWREMLSEGQAPPRPAWVDSFYAP